MEPRTSVTRGMGSFTRGVIPERATTRGAADLTRGVVAILKDQDSTLHWRAPGASDHGIAIREDESRKRSNEDEELNSLEIAEHPRGGASTTNRVIVRQEIAFHHFVNLVVDN
ncbi:hypothetical protein L195_g045107 [Trifolium pratense]|uniref:Uncharacterized protein n=1 Tax=Trifolium pratense TaxID=57577 RepID=A0A2K3MDW7_TRIPR|nr:hypothetical protein L195_g045107 [Trifolium pratense]